MSKPKRLQALPETVLQPVVSFRPRLVFSRDDSSGAGVSSGLTARVLIVEDDYLAAGEMDAELTAAGFEVIGLAASAKEAITLAGAERPHLVVMDIRLEGAMYGVDAAIAIFNSLGIRSLFASAYHDPETRRRAAPSSPLGWLAKPYTMSALVESVRAVLRDLGPPGNKS
jgi:DNA-binding NarL/FixJ family response regulator